MKEKHESRKSQCGKQGRGKGYPMRTFVQSVLMAALMACAIGLTGCAGTRTRAADKDWQQLQGQDRGESAVSLETAEREVSESEVPAAALRALRQQAGGRPLVAFEEEIRNGRKYYEGEWEGETGEQEATVTADGILIETEMDMTAEQVPQPVRRRARRLAGDAEVCYARRNFVLYEIEYIENGEEREILLTPTGRHVGTEVTKDGRPVD